MYKFPYFVLPIPMCDQQVFPPHIIDILLSSKQVLNENKDKYQTCVRETV